MIKYGRGGGGGVKGSNPIKHEKASFMIDMNLTVFDRLLISKE